MFKKIAIAFVVALSLSLIGLAVLVFADPFDYSGVDEEYVMETTLKIESGEVVINGSVATDGQILNEGDTIEVGDNASASVVFFDDSVSRLQSGTKLSLEILDDENFEYGQSQILIDLATGEVWSKIQKQTSPDITFSVKTVSVNATIRGSAINVLAKEGGESEVFTTEHSALISNLDPLTGQVLDRQEIEEGFKAVVTGEKKLEVNNISDIEKNADWFTKNLDKDGKYQQDLRAKIKERQIKKAGALPGTFGYKIKNLQDKLKVSRAKDKEDTKLTMIERKLAEASLLMEQGKGDLAQIQMEQVEKMIKELSEIKRPDIRKRIAKSIQKSKRELRQTLPSDKDYKIKNFISDLEIEIAPENVRNRLKEANLNRRMIDLYDLSKIGDEESMRNLIEELKNELNNNEDFRDLINRGAINPYLKRMLMNGELEKIMQSMNFKDIEMFRKIIEDLKNGEMDADAMRLKLEEELRKQQEELQKLRDAGVTKQPQRGSIIKDPVKEIIPEIIKEAEEAKPAVEIDDSIRLLDKIVS